MIPEEDEGEDEEEEGGEGGQGKKGPTAARVKNFFKSCCTFRKGGNCEDAVLGAAAMELGYLVPDDLVYGNGEEEEEVPEENSGQVEGNMAESASSQETGERQGGDEDADSAVDDGAAANGDRGDEDEDEEGDNAEDSQSAEGSKNPKGCFGAVTHKIRMFVRR